MIKLLNNMVVTVLGLGYAPKAPGTVTSVVVAPFLFFAYGFHSTFYVRLITTIVTFFVAWFFVIQYLRTHGNKDHSEITIDELLGMQCTFLAGIGDDIENSNAERIIFTLIGFSLFRFFDIWKPWLVGWVDKNMKSAFGVIFDDVVAGFFSLVGLQLIIALGKII